AGYPDKSALPSSYKRPSASPLAEAKVVSNSVAKPNETPKAPESAAPEVPVAPPAAGIRF
ncbi:MAG: NrdH-redoxin, partial [Hydrogenophaga sp.]